MNPIDKTPHHAPLTHEPCGIVHSVPPQPPTAQEIPRRMMLRDGLRLAGVFGILGTGGYLVARQSSTDRYVWQIDPYQCTLCGRCATTCVLDESAVRCVHSYVMCGFCNRCMGFFDQKAAEFNSAAENQVCPTGAITRRWVQEEDYFEYIVHEDLCIGCGKCAVGCNAFGNGSLYLQIRQDRCKNCNRCAIADACPSQAIVRTPSETPYLYKHLSEAAQKAAARDAVYENQRKSSSPLEPNHDPSNADVEKLTKNSQNHPKISEGALA